MKPKGNQQVRSLYRCGTTSCGVKSLEYDPKPGDLGVGRMKRDESCVEVRRDVDVQITLLTCV